MEVYSWCRSRNMFRLWTYLFVNWYCPGQWELWARSANDTGIPVLKTTMIVESHWRRVKHDYLHQFNRPRIDLVAWILSHRIVPDAVFRMKAIQSGNYQVAKASWRKAFKREWVHLQGKCVEQTSLQRYHVNPRDCVCACSSFLDSRFLICKHLVHCFLPFASPARFFCGVQRQRTPPFWVHSDLNVIPEFAENDSAVGVADLEEVVHLEPTEPESMLDNGVLELDVEESLAEEGSERGSVADSSDEQSESESEYGPTYQAYKATMHASLDMAEEQHLMGNREFVNRHMASNASNQILVDEVNQIRNRQTMAPTWGRRRHPATRYWE